MGEEFRIKMGSSIPGRQMTTLVRIHDETILVRIDDETILERINNETILVAWSDVVTVFFLVTLMGRRRMSHVSDDFESSCNRLEVENCYIFRFLPRFYFIFSSRDTIAPPRGYISSFLTKQIYKEWLQLIFL